jgi:hypothetical protein
MRGDSDVKHEDTRMTLEEYRRALGLTRYAFLEAIGEPRHSELLKHAESRRPIAAIKAEAICSYLSKEFQKPIKIKDVKGLEVV